MRSIDIKTQKLESLLYFSPRFGAKHIKFQKESLRRLVGPYVVQEFRNVLKYLIGCVRGKTMFRNLDDGISFHKTHFRAVWDLPTTRLQKSMRTSYIRLLPGPLRETIFATENHLRTSPINFNFSPREPDTRPANCMESMRHFHRRVGSRISPKIALHLIPKPDALS